MKYQPPDIAKFKKAEEALFWLLTADAEPGSEKFITETLQDFSPAEHQEFVHWLMTGARDKLEMGEIVWSHLKR